jgi:hypothetical protein
MARPLAGSAAAPVATVVTEESLPVAAEATTSKSFFDDIAADADLDEISFEDNSTRAIEIVEEPAGKPKVEGWGDGLDIPEFLR